MNEIKKIGNLLKEEEKINNNSIQQSYFFTEIKYENNIQFN